MGRLGNSFWDEDDPKMKKQKINQNSDIFDDDEDSVSNEEKGGNMSDDGISIIKFININYH